MKALKLLSVLFIFLHTSNVEAQEEWKLNKMKNGIEVYTRPMEGSKYKAAKASTEVEVSVSSVIAMISDLIDGYDWIYALKYIEVLDEQADTVQIYYIESKAPWPFENRDAIYEHRYRYDEKTDQVLVVVNCLPDYLPEKKKLQRIPKGEGYWLCTPLDGERTHVEFFVHFEPGGTLPAWLTNAFAVDSPYETLLKVKTLVQQEKYQNATFNFMNSGE